MRRPATGGISRQQPALHQHFRDLHRVKRRTLADVVAGNEKGKPVFNALVPAYAADLDIVRPGNVYRSHH